MGVIVLKLESLGVAGVVMIAIGRDGLGGKAAAGETAAVTALGALAALIEGALPSACVSDSFKDCPKFVATWSD